MRLARQGFFLALFSALCGVCCSAVEIPDDRATQAISVTTPNFSAPFYKNLGLDNRAYDRLGDAVVIMIPVDSQSVGKQLVKGLLSARVAFGASVLNKTPQQTVVLVTAKQENVPKIRAFVERHKLTKYPLQEAPWLQLNAMDTSSIGEKTPETFLTTMTSIAEGTNTALSQFSDNSSQQDQQLSDLVPQPEEQVPPDTTTTTAVRSTTPVKEVVLHIEESKQTEFHASVRVNAPLLVTVTGRPSTGYVWQVNRQLTGPLLQLGSFEISKGKVAQIGGPVLFQLRVIPSEKGEFPLVLDYVRPWSPDDDPDRKTIIVHVTEE